MTWDRALLYADYIGERDKAQMRAAAITEMIGAALGVRIPDESGRDARTPSITAEEHAKNVFDYGEDGAEQYEKNYLELMERQRKKRTTDER